MMIHLPHLQPLGAIEAAIIGVVFARLAHMVFSVFFGTPADRERLQQPQQSRPPCDWSKDDE